MKKILSLFMLLSAIVIYLPAIADAAETAMIEKARIFMESLETQQKEKAFFAFDDQERFNFNFVPIERKGLSYEDMTGSQRDLLKAFLESALSGQGYQKVRAIMQHELILREIEERGADDRYRNPENYYISIFGEPSEEQPWGWRFEGHHLSLNFTSGDGEVAVTPAFWGANPAHVLQGPQQGLQILKEEEEIGRSLILSMNPDQKMKAVIAEDAPNEILTSNHREASLEKMEGINYDQLEASQKEMLMQLLEVYLDNLQEDLAEIQLQKVLAGGVENLFFAWAGSTEKGKRHYYRLHGPSILIEYDNTQNNANHIHSVWRDMTSDFGLDLLKKHYQESEHHRNR